MESSPLKAAEDTSQKINVYPLLSPEMESNLLKEPWPQLDTNTQINSTTFWGENFQDLSNWCVVDPQKVNPVVHTAQLKGQHAIQKHQDYHIGEEIKSKNSGVKDNYDNLSHNKSELKDIKEILGENNWTVDKNIISTGGEGGMSFDGSLPIGQDEFNTITEISDVWFDQSLATTHNSTGMDDEQHNITYISNNPLLVSDTSSNENLLTDHHSVDIIGETIANWLPIDITNQNICNDLVTNMNIQFDNFVSNEHQSTSVNFNNDDKLEKKHMTNDILLTTEVGSATFDLLSYVCNEDGNLQESKNTDEEKEKSNTSDKETRSLEIGNINNNNNNNISSNSNDTRKSCREKRITKRVREKVDPYILPPVRINVKNNKILSVKKSGRKTSSKQTDQESCGNDTDSGDSDTTQTSDYNYRELREKNNMASRKSRINKKVKESEMLRRANDLERNNAVLKMKVEELEKLVTSMRTALLQSALKKEKN